VYKRQVLRETYGRTTAENNNKNMKRF